MKNSLPKASIPQLVTFTLLAMGCHIQISLNITRLRARYSQALIDQQVALLTSEVQQQLIDWEHTFSRFDETSEIMRLNNNTDQWTTVSAELFAVLQSAIYFVAKTQGLVTPTLLNSICAAGYKQSFETLPKPPLVAKQASTVGLATDSRQCLQRPRLTSSSNEYRRNSSKNSSNTDDNSSHQHIERIQLRLLANGEHQVYLPTGMALDLNGYVKGWCAMQLAEQISKSHDYPMPCLVDMGGDIAIGVVDDQDINKPIVWGIAVAKAQLNTTAQVDNQQDEDVAILAISSGAVATSGQDYRRWWHGDQWQHHLIDPDKNAPVVSDVLTATVVATDTLTAEVYAKYCVLLGVKQAMAWLKQHHIAALLITTDNQVIASAAILPKLVQPNLIAS